MGCADATLGIPLFANNTIIQQPTELETLSQKYGDEMERFISTSAAAQEPFFLYFAASHVHVPLNVNPSFVNASGLNIPFHDALMELDHSVGRITAALTQANVDDNTLILVTGDNGPWGCKCLGKLAGSAGPFEGAWQRNQGGGGSSWKTTIWEGGHRVIGLARFPGKITPAVSGALVSSMDYMPTLAELAGVALPTDRQFDGISMVILLFDPNHNHTNSSGHHTLFHPLSDSGGSGPLDGMRMGQYKAFWTTAGACNCGGIESKVIYHNPPLLFDLSVDEAEAFPLNTTVPPYSLIARQLSARRQQMLDDVNSTFRSTANYESSDAGRAVNCCNQKHITCRCTN